MRTLTFLISLLLLTGCGNKQEVLVKYIKTSPGSNILKGIPPPKLISSKEYMKLGIIGRERYLTRVLLVTFNINKKLNYRLRLTREWYRDEENKEAWIHTPEMVKEGN